LCHDGSDEVLDLFPETKSGALRAEVQRGKFGAHGVYGRSNGGADGTAYSGDSGSAARFFYCAKPSKAERGEGNTHVAVKPLALMRWLVRLVTPPGGTVLDPFAGSGTTGLAAVSEGFSATLIEAEASYADIIASRLARAAPTQGTLI
jgi:site-specific DNA-methyltransferase (adenine-specific)